MILLSDVVTIFCVVCSTFSAILGGNKQLVDLDGREFCLLEENGD